MWEVTRGTMHDQTLSIVTTLYRSSSYLPSFCERVAASASSLGVSYELILVNDGSPDDALHVGRGLLERYPTLKIVDLSRNFGHHAAIMEGLRHASGDRVFLIDCDLEEPPEVLLEFWAALSDPELDVVYGVQEQRKGGWFERFSGTLFYRLFNRISSHPVPLNLLTVRLMRRAYVDALLLYQERELFLGGIFSVAGFHQQAHPVAKHDKGSSTYTLGRKIDLFVNSVTSFSSRPLVWIFYLGSFIVFASLVAGFALVIRALLSGTYLTGWPSLMVSIWFLGGLCLFSIGIVGIYVSKIFTEIKGRPTLVRRLYGRGLKEGSS